MAHFAYVLVYVKKSRTGQGYHGHFPENRNTKIKSLDLVETKKLHKIFQLFGTNF